MVAMAIDKTIVIKTIVSMVRCQYNGKPIENKRKYG